MAGTNDVKRWIAELRAAGWIEVRFNIWQRPNDGAWFRGPYGAWAALQAEPPPVPLPTWFTACTLKQHDFGVLHSPTESRVFCRTCHRSEVLQVREACHGLGLEERVQSIGVPPACDRCKGTGRKPAQQNATPAQLEPPEGNP